MNARPTTSLGLCSIVAVLLLVATLTTRGAASSLAPGFKVQAWSTEDGLPDTSINALARTPDGYLWLGTSAGLVRFDGARFVILTTNTAPALRDNHISSLLVDTNGVLWVGTQEGTLARRDADHFIQVPLDLRLRGVTIKSLAPALAGGLWLATRGCGLVRLDRGTCDFSTPTNGLRQGEVTSLVREESGRLWVVSDMRLMTLEQGRWLRVPPGPDANALAYAVASGQGDGPWIATDSENSSRTLGGRVFQFANGQSFREITPYPWRQDSQRARIRSVLEDHAGRVWVGTAGNGVFFWTPGVGWRRLASDILHTGERLLVMMEDAQDLIWIAGSQGTLYQVQERQVTTLRLSPDEVGPKVTSAFVARDGNVWVGTDDAGVFRLVNGAFTPATDGLAYPHVYSVLVDGRTNLWAGTGRGLYRWQNTQFVQYLLPGPSNSEVVVLYEDRRGNLWAGTAQGLVRITPEGATSLFAEAAGLGPFTFLSMAEDAQGRLWVAVRGRGLYRLAGERFEKVGSGRWPELTGILGVQADTDGALWITTGSAGLLRFKDDSFRQWTRQEGLPETVLNKMIQDDHGNLWFSSDKGIFGCPKAALLADRGSGSPPPLFWHLSVEEGMDSKACSGLYQPVLARSSDGRLWFPNQNALAVFDPAKVATAGSTLVPIEEEVMADGVPRQPDGVGVLRLRSDARRVEFHYTCPDLRSPARLRFRYRLEGSDPDWTDAGKQRVAYYGHLPPGDYRFRVMAAGATGAWREAVEALRLTIVPRWWERASVRAAGALAGAALLGGTVWWLTWTRHRRRLVRLERARALERERARIAKDIHDDLGAKLTEMTLLSELAQGPEASPEEVQADLRTIARKARDLTGTLSETVWAVNPRNDTLDSFVTYACNYTEDYLRLGGVRCHLEIPGSLPARVLSSEVRHHLFLVFKEALNNIVKHAAASEVRVRVALRSDGFTLTIQDDGKGFNPDDPGAAAGNDPARPPGRRAQGNGLLNMRQRVEDLRGRFELWSQPAHGTRIQVELDFPKP